MTTKTFITVALLGVLILGCSGEAELDHSATNTQRGSAPSQLLVEGHSEPINIHSLRPAFSWLTGTRAQTFYQIQVSSSKSKLKSGEIDLWDSGKIQASHSRNIEYQGAPLATNARAYWRVRTWSPDSDIPSAWSDITFWEMGLLNKSDWQASWIQAPVLIKAQNSQAVNHWVALAATVEKTDGSFDQPAIELVQAMPTASLFRHEFILDKKVAQAKLLSTAGGYYELFINGKQVKDRLMDPAQTDFDKRILYNADNVITHLKTGSNVIGVHLGSGWYDEGVAFNGWKNPDAKNSNKPDTGYSFGQPAFIAQLELTFEDGSTRVVGSSDAWQTHPSPVLKEGIFSGELYDAQQEVPGWHSESGDLNTGNWRNAATLPEWPTQNLSPQLIPPIRPTKPMTPVKIYQPKHGVWVYDFGQNFTGIPTLHLDQLDLDAGDAVFLRYAEWADDEGNISQLSGGGWATNLNAVDAYIANDKHASHWTPSFTWRGFRYVEITGLDGQPPLSALSAQWIRSDVARVGQFKSSDPLINKIHQTALATYESNLMSVPLDCPLREKAGWTGDAHAALVTANYNYNMDTFWQKYLGDFKTAKFIAPAVVPGKRTVGEKIDWAVAEVFVAWEHYRHHGKLSVLESQYDSLSRYMDFGQSQMSAYLIDNGFGDWCDPVPSPGTPRVGGRGVSQWTEKTITTTALFARAADYMSKIASALNKEADSDRYTTLYTNLSHGFHQAFYNPDTGHYGSQTADAMALRFKITPLELRQSVADALNKDVLENWKGHSSVGALGQSWLYLALSDYGYADTAFGIFKAPGYPGFQYLFDDLNGTTLWERKGQFNPSSGKAPSRSLNHPFHSGYDGWFYQGLGGIRPLENSVGFQRFLLKPVFPKDLDWVDVRYDSGYGDIISTWQRKENGIDWQFTIPNNTSAIVRLPGKNEQLYSAGSYSMLIEQ